MSVMPIEDRIISCPIEQKLRKHSSEIGSLSLIRKTFEKQFEEADVELGDSLVWGCEEINVVKAQVGIQLSEKAAAELFNAVNSCLQQRYLGNCAIASHCSGRREVDEILNDLNIPRYKPTDEEAIS